MPIFTAIAAAIGLTGFFASAFVVGAEFIASIGISYLASALAGKPAATDSSANMGMQGAIQAAGNVPRSFPLGACATAGSLVYANTWGNATVFDPSGNAEQAPNAYLTQVIALSDLPGCELTGIWVNGQKVNMYNTDDHVTGWGRPVAEYDKNGSHLWVRFYDGTQTTPDPFLVGAVSSADRPYQSTRVGTGIAYAIVTALTEDTLFTGFPSFLFEVSGTKLYDPTKDDTNGGTGAMRYSDPTTWGGDGDDLPGVQLYNLLRGFRYDNIWLCGLQNMTQARLPAVNWNTQIAKCRDQIQGVSGLEPTYRAGGQMSVDAQPATAVQSLLSACSGRLSEVGGFYKVQIGAPDSPAFAFTDDDILSTETQSFTPFLGLADSVNGITATYPDPTQSWQMTPAPPLYDTDFETEDGNRRLLANPTLDFVPYPAQVQRLMKSALLDARRERQHTITLPPAFWISEPGDFCTWTSNRNGYDAKQFRIDGTIDKANLDITFSLTEVDPTDYAWNHDTDFKQPTQGATTFPRPAPQGIVDWNVTATVVNDGTGVPRRPAIALSWDGTIAAVIGVQYEVRLTADQSSVARGRTDQVAAATLLITQSLLPATAYQVRGQYIPSAPRDMLWSDWIDVTTLDIRLTALDFADEIIAQINNIEQFDAAGIQQAINTIASLAANAMTTAWLDKKEIRSQLDATAGNAKAEILELQTVQVNDQVAFAEFQTTVSATFGSTFSSVNTVSDAVAQIDGYAASSFGLTLDTNGFVIGYQLVNGGPGADEFVITADKFQIAAPGVMGGDPTPIFTVANVDGVPKTSLRGDLFADGTVTLNALDVGTLSALVVQSFDGKMVLDFTNKRFTISD